MMEEILKRISKKSKKKNSLSNKKDHYKVGKYLIKGEKVKWTREQLKGARRTYQYYYENKGNWEGPLPQQFEKMIKEEFDEAFKGRKQWREEVLLKTTPDQIQSCDENHIDHVITTILLVLDEIQGSGEDL